MANTSWDVFSEDWRLRKEHHRNFHKTLQLSHRKRHVIAEKQQVVDERVYPKQHLLAGCFFGLHMIEYYFLPNLRPVDFMDQTLLKISFLVAVSKMIIYHNWDNPFGNFTSSWVIMETPKQLKHKSSENVYVVLEHTQNILV